MEDLDMDWFREVVEVYWLALLENRESRKSKFKDMEADKKKILQIMQGSDLVQISKFYQ